MGVSLSKGQKVDLTKSHPGLQSVIVGLGWDVSHNSSSFDLDASAFLLDASGKVHNDQDFIFYNNPTGGNGSVVYTGDNRTGTGERDDEQIRIELNRVPASIHRIAFTITIHDAVMKGQNFGQVANAYVRIFNPLNNEELIRFSLGRDFTVETAIVTAELYRHNGEWKFNAIASGFQGGLAALCRNFGVTVDDAPPQPGYTPQYNANSAQPSIGGTANSGSFGQPSFGQNNSASIQNQYTGYNQQSTSFPAGQSFTPSTGSFGNTSHSQTYGGENIVCPRCHSTNIRTGQKGFGIGKAAIGGLILGPVGLLGGFIGKNQLKFSCSSCGNTWSPSKTDYMEWANQQKQRAMELFNKFKSQDVLDAVVAACALVGMADGRLDPSERQKMLEFVSQSAELRVFDTNKVIQQFNYFVQKIEYDFIIGRAEAFRALGKVRNKPEIARLIARYCISIGFADGHFDPKEQQMVSDICRELGLNPAEFLS